MKRRLSTLNNLTITHPELVKEWCDLNSINNSKLIPENFLDTSNEYIYWKCRNYHIYGCTISDRTRINAGCPYCINKKAHSQNNLTITHPELMKEWSSFNEIKPSEISRGSMESVIWRCNKNHYYLGNPNSRTSNNTGCAYCWGRKSYSQTSLTNIAEKFLHEWSDLNSMEDDFKHLNPKNFGRGSHQDIIWRCRYGHYACKSIHTQLGSHVCGFCSNRDVCWDNCIENTHQFLLEEWDYSSNKCSPREHTKGSSYRAHWICKFGHKWQADITDRICNKTGCPKCSNRISGPETEWLDILDVSIRNDVIKIFRSSKVDGLSDDRKIVYEFHGDYWHGNPNIYKENDLNKRTKKTFGELYQATLERDNKIKELGYFLVKIWEEEYKNFVKLYGYDQEILKIKIKEHANLQIMEQKNTQFINMNWVFGVFDEYWLMAS